MFNMDRKKERKGKERDKTKKERERWGGSEIKRKPAIE